MDAPTDPGNRHVLFLSIIKIVYIIKFYYITVNMSNGIRVTLSATNPRVLGSIPLGGCGVFFF